MSYKEHDTETFFQDREDFNYQPSPRYRMHSYYLILKTFWKDQKATLEVVFLKQYRKFALCSWLLMLAVSPSNSEGTLRKKIFDGLLRNNVKTNRIVSTKWTYHKEQSLASNYFIFWKILFEVTNSYKELIWSIKNSNAYIPTFCKRWSFIWWCFFPVNILK